MKSSSLRNSMDDLLNSDRGDSKSIRIHPQSFLNDDPIIPMCLQFTKILAIDIQCGKCQMEFDLVNMNLIFLLRISLMTHWDPVEKALTQSYIQNLKKDTVIHDMTVPLYVMIINFFRSTERERTIVERTISNCLLSKTKYHERPAERDPHRSARE